MTSGLIWASGLWRGGGQVRRVQEGLCEGSRITTCVTLMQVWKPLILAQILRALSGHAITSPQ